MGAEDLLKAMNVVDGLLDDGKAIQRAVAVTVAVAVLLQRDVRGDAEGGVSGIRPAIGGGDDALPVVRIIHDELWVVL